MGKFGIRTKLGRGIVASLMSWQKFRDAALFICRF